MVVLGWNTNLPSVGTGLTKIPQGALLWIGQGGNDNEKSCLEILWHGEDLAESTDFFARCWMEPEFSVAPKTHDQGPWRGWESLFCVRNIHCEWTPFFSLFICVFLILIQSGGWSHSNSVDLSYLPEEGHFHLPFLNDRLFWFSSLVSDFRSCKRSAKYPRGGADWQTYGKEWPRQIGWFLNGDSKSFRIETLIFHPRKWNWYLVWMEWLHKIEFFLSLERVEGSANTYNSRAEEPRYDEEAGEMTQDFEGFYSVMLILDLDSWIDHIFCFLLHLLTFHGNSKQNRHH